MKGRALLVSSLVTVPLKPAPPPTLLADPGPCPSHPCSSSSLPLRSGGSCCGAAFGGAPVGEGNPASSFVPTGKMCPPGEGIRRSPSVQGTRARGMWLRKQKGSGFQSRLPPADPMEMARWRAGTGEPVLHRARAEAASSPLTRPLAQLLSPALTARQRPDHA